MHRKQIVVFCSMVVVEIKLGQNVSLGNYRLRKNSKYVC